ncbi:hypothetical protein [Endozoicomonas atrinae]|uniref:hypothetical protein n=1 Tax=Endozoicomonas atrinae TaxID=1333660 RepID=UPI000825E73A|nr:hypothetical protein [Endozoicomonas atrinae]
MLDSYGATQSGQATGTGFTNTAETGDTEVYTQCFGIRVKKQNVVMRKLRAAKEWFYKGSTPENKTLDMRKVCVAALAGIGGGIFFLSAVAATGGGAIAGMGLGAGLIGCGYVGAKLIKRHDRQLPQSSQP